MPHLETSILVKEEMKNYHSLDTVKIKKVFLYYMPAAIYDFYKLLNAKEVNKSRRISREIV
jgi:hypothetical protein